MAKTTRKWALRRLEQCIEKFEFILLAIKDILDAGYSQKDEIKNQLELLARATIELQSAFTKFKENL